MTDSKKTTFNIFDTKEIISPDDNTILEEYEAYFLKQHIWGL